MRTKFTISCSWRALSLGRRPANAAILSCGVQTIFCAFTQLGALEFGERSYNCIIMPSSGDVVSIASVKL